MDKLRHVKVDGYTLETWDTGREDHHGKATLAYRFSSPEGVPIFEGEDFHCSPCHATDSDATLRALLGFLTLRPGDTDREYFADYTPEQLAFAQGDAEQLSLYGHEQCNDDGEDGTCSEHGADCLQAFVDVREGE